jgi:hypothetical protein
MVAKYLAHFGLKTSPFSKEISDADLWLPPSKKVVLEEQQPARCDKPASDIGILGWAYQRSAQKGWSRG